jgi:tetratricopeptide (TPR) repeat protein
MDPDLLYILNENVNKKSFGYLSQIYKPGTFIGKPNENWDEITLARYNYILNLCAFEPKVFNIPDQIDILERCCMMFSFGDYSLLTDDFFEHDLLGLYNHKTGEQLLYVNVKRCEIRDKYEYSARGIVSSDLLIHPLTIKEQTIMCLYMIKTYNEIKCKELRHLKVQAYLDRLCFPKNDTSFLILRIVEFYNSLINRNFNCSNLEKVSQKMYFLDQNDTFSIPIIFRRDIELQLAHAYRDNGYFLKSKEIYAFYYEVDLEIECLLQLVNKSEAIRRLKTHLKNIETTNFENKIKYSNYCIKIAQLSDDITYFDKACSICQGYEPLYYKGVHFFTQKDFNRSLDAFNQALVIVPENETILFAYACCLKELNQFQEAADTFERLVEKNKKKAEYHKDLALCRLQIGDYEKCIISLKQVILDPNCAELFFRLAFAKRLKSELLWVFSKAVFTDTLKDKIYLVVKAEILTEDEVMESIDRNPKLRALIDKLKI